MKKLHDETELIDFKTIVNVLETEEEFIGKNLAKFA